MDESKRVHRAGYAAELTHPDARLLRWTVTTEKHGGFTMRCSDAEVARHGWRPTTVKSLPAA